MQAAHLQCLFFVSKAAPAFSGTPAQAEKVPSTSNLRLLTRPAKTRRGTPPPHLTFPGAKSVVKNQANGSCLYQRKTARTPAPTATRRGRGPCPLSHVTGRGGCWRQEHSERNFAAALRDEGNSVNVLPRAANWSPADSLRSTAPWYPALKLPPSAAARLLPGLRGTDFFSFPGLTEKLYPGASRSPPSRTQSLSPSASSAHFPKGDPDPDCLS